MHHICHSCHSKNLVSIIVIQIKAIQLLWTDPNRMDAYFSTILPIRQTIEHLAEGCIIIPLFPFLMINYCTWFCMEFRLPDQKKNHRIKTCVEMLRTPYTLKHRPADTLCKHSISNKPPENTKKMSYFLSIISMLFTVRNELYQIPISIWKNNQYPYEFHE